MKERKKERKEKMRKKSLSLSSICLYESKMKSYFRSTPRIHVEGLLLTFLGNGSLSVVERDEQT